MANAVLLQKTLRLGVDEQLYCGFNASPAQAGAVQTTGAMAAFGIPPQCSNYRGTVWFQFVAILASGAKGGTVTAATFTVETSLDGGTTWGAVTKLFPVTGAPATLTTYSALAAGTFTTTPIVIAVDLSGLGGNGQIRLNFSTVTLGTASGFDVYAHMG